MRIETAFEAIEVDDFKDGDPGFEPTMSLWFSATEDEPERFVFLDRERVIQLKEALEKVLSRGN